ncbi:MAG: hypothetical protein HY096_11640 [Nitrospinae bacterium]|nr:hypothetical protein [Nitrospinota bacterium]
MMKKASSDKLQETYEVIFTKPLFAKRLQGYYWMGYCRGVGRGNDIKYRTRLELDSFEFEEKNIRIVRQG